MIVNQIEYCLNNYQEAIKDFDSYRDFIRQEKDIFKKDIIRLFE